jgi:hypothetical protein
MATIEKTSYNADSKVLTIVFGYAPDTEYQYQNVDAADGSAMDAADSKGKFFHAVIKPKYGADFVKVESL